MNNTVLLVASYYRIKSHLPQGGGQGALKNRDVEVDLSTCKGFMVTFRGENEPAPYPQSDILVPCRVFILISDDTPPVTFVWESPPSSQGYIHGCTCTSEVWN